MDIENEPIQDTEQEDTARPSRVRLFSISQEQHVQLLNNKLQEKTKLDTFLEKEPTKDKLSHFQRIQKKFPVNDDGMENVVYSKLENTIHNIEDLPSLVKYDEPIAINVNEKCSQYNTATKQKKRAEIKSIDVLNEIFPTRCWVDNRGRRLRQSVSLQAADRSELIELNGKFDLYLSLTEANPVGLCAFRHKLYAQCFNELLRQVTIVSVPYGLLFVHLRDNMVKTDFYNDKLLDSAVEFGKSQAISKEDDQELTDAELKLIELKQREISLDAQVKASKIEYDRIKQRNKEFETLMRLKKEKEIEFLKKIVEQLRAQKESIIMVKSSIY